MSYIILTIFLNQFQQNIMLGTIYSKVIKKKQEFEQCAYTLNILLNIIFTILIYTWECNLN